MTLSIAQEFSTALVAYRAEEDTFKPLLAKLEELKQVLQNNFNITTNEGPWYGFSKPVTRPVISVTIKDKITNSSGNYLYIRIGETNYVMGLGEVGELKDRLYFIEGRYMNNDKGREIVYIASHLFGVCDFCLEDKITNVQLFSDLIKRYKKYLITNG